MSSDNLPAVGTQAAPPRPQDVEAVDTYGALTPEQYKGRRQALMRFIKDQLTEAVYQNGRILKTNDYYRLPGSEKLALSKKGAELLGDHYKYKIARVEIDNRVLEKDFVSVSANVTLHRSNIVVAAQVASCSSAEPGFQRQAKKYGGEYDKRAKKAKNVDWRAALNDIEARAQKRAYVRAMIAACAASDILEVADDGPSGDDVQDLGPEDYEDVTPRPADKGGVTPAQLQRLLTLSADPAVDQAQRASLATWLNSPKASAEGAEELIVRLEEQIEAAA